MAERPDDQHAASIAYHREQEADSALSDMMERLPAFVSRGLLYVILVFSAVAFSWAALNKIDVIVAVPAVVIPEGKLKIIQPPFPGMVQEIRVQEGEAVRQGDVLIVYESSAVSDLLSELKAREAEMAVAKVNLEVAMPRKVGTLEGMIEMEGHALDRRELIHDKNLDKLDEQMSRLGLEIENARGRLGLLDREVEVNAKLAAKGFVAQRKMLELRRLREEAAIAIESLRSTLRETRINKEIEVEQFNLELEQFGTKVSELQQQIAEQKRGAEERYEMAMIQFDQSRDLAHLNLDGVNREIIEQASRGRGQTTDTAVIVAPIDGIIAQIDVRNPGEAIDRGQTLITLVPEGVTLISELRIPDKDIGKVRVGQSIKFKFEAFPFAEHGVLTGAVESIGPSAVSAGQEGGNYYLAKSPLNQDYFRVEGRKANLLPGMTAMAEIRTDEKSVLSLMLKPFAELADPDVAER